VGDTGSRAVIRREQYPGRAGVLQLDEVRLVLDVERLSQPFRERVIAVPHVDAEFAERGMDQEAAPEKGVMLGPDRTPLAHALHPLGAAAARSMQAQPMAARLEPGLDGAGLRGVRVRAGHVRDQKAAQRQPFLDVREVVGDGSRDVPFGEEREEPQAGMVVIVSGAGTGRETTGYEMGAGKSVLCH
jgi:hypothetical protein